MWFLDTNLVGVVFLFPQNFLVLRASNPTKQKFLDPPPAKENVYLDTTRIH